MLRRERGREPLRGAAPRAALTPLVGREEEIELLLRRWQRAKSGEGQVVLLSGEPGIGKSRLVARAAGAARGRAAHRCAISARRTTRTARSIRSSRQLERAAGFAREDTPERKLDKLEALLARRTPSRRRALLAELLSIADRRRATRRSTSARSARRKRRFEALLGQLRALARRGRC